MLLPTFVIKPTTSARSSKAMRSKGCLTKPSDFTKDFRTVVPP
ncbi:hypothetical protein OROHE_017500 [Orobanche hederae]